MNKQSLGLIETIGLSAAIEAADTAVKSANVTLIGYELTKGGGLVVVKLLGEVGAVNAAIDAAKVSAAKVNRVFATKIIARMGEGVADILSSCHDVKQTHETKMIEPIIEKAQHAKWIHTTVDNEQSIAITTISTQVQADGNDCLAVLDIEPIEVKPIVKQSKKKTLKSNKKTIKTDEKF